MARRADRSFGGPFSTIARKRPVTRRTSAEVDEIVLAALDAADAPLSAYELTEHITRRGLSLAPAQIYRALGRLVSQGEACRIESLSAYVRSRQPADYVAICTVCQRIRPVSAPDLPEVVKASAAAIGFEVERVVVEVIGRCPDCRAD